MAESALAESEQKIPSFRGVVVVMFCVSLRPRGFLKGSGEGEGGPRGLDRSGKWGKG